MHKNLEGGQTPLESRTIKKLGEQHQTSEHEEVDPEPDIITKITVLKPDGTSYDHIFPEKFIVPGRAYNEDEKQDIANRVMRDAIPSGGCKEIHLHTEPTPEQKRKFQKSRGITVYPYKYDYKSNNQKLHSSSRNAYLFRRKNQQINARP